MGDTFKSVSYSGTESYKHVEQIIAKGSRIMISSPYIDEYYADFIIRNCKGKRIYVLASSIDKTAKYKLQGGIAYKPIIMTLIALVAIGFIGYALRTYIITVLSGIAAAAFTYLKARSPRGNASVSLKIPKAFVHAKMYISEAAAAEGSANLTYKGMHKNVEHVEFTENTDKIKDLERQFWAMWNSQ